MALMDFIRGQFIDIIQWTDDSRDTFRITRAAVEEFLKA
jgi:membrane protease subunit (stomatin/prohibitin family)